VNLCSPTLWLRCFPGSSKSELGDLIFYYPNSA